jgi:hypothetical protein
VMRATHTAAILEKFLLDRRAPQKKNERRLAVSSPPPPRRASFGSIRVLRCPSMISAKLTGRPSLSVALSESERIFS